MIEKKTFDLFNPKPEEDYLNQKAKEGLILVDVNEEGYHFNEGDPQELYYLVEYFDDVDKAEDLSMYQRQGFKLVTRFFTKKGIWIYFVNKQEEVEEPIFRQLTGRQVLLKKALNRVELFSMSIAIALVVLAIFMIIRYQNWAYYLLLLLGLIFLGYIFSIYLKLKKAHKLMNNQEV